MSSSLKSHTAEELLKAKAFLSLVQNKLLIRYYLKRDYHTYESCIVVIAGGIAYPGREMETFFKLSGGFSIGSAFAPLNLHFSCTYGKEQSRTALGKLLNQWEGQAKNFPAEQVMLQPREFVGKLDLGNHVRELTEDADDLHFHHGAVVEHLSNVNKRTQAEHSASATYKDAIRTAERRFGQFVARLRHAHAARVYGTEMKYE